MSYYLAPALAVLRAEINQRWPNRDRASDGWIGDAAHQATKSDHNPNERGSVDALDVDVDGVTVAEILAAVERHPSAHYWIYNRQIADRDDGWRRRPYSGPSPHTEHLHVSIRQTRTAEQDTRPWGLREDDIMATLDELRAVVRQELTDIRSSVDYVDGRIEGLAYGRTEVREGLKGAGAPVWPVEALRSLQEQVTALTARPPAVIDYDQLADAIVRRAFGVTPGTP